MDKNRKYNIAYVVCVIIKLYYIPWNYAEITRNAVLKQNELVTVAQCKNSNQVIQLAFRIPQLEIKPVTAINHPRAVVSSSQNEM